MARRIDQARSRLATQGLTAADVNLVTVGMGGNDAKFGQLVAACLIPNLAKELAAAYPDMPASLGFIANHLLTCERLDKIAFKVGDAIEQLAAKQRFAQQQLRIAFPNADIFQVNYPGVLPNPDDAPAWCGDIGASDIEYADTQARRINDVIGDTVSQAAEDDAALDRYYAPVDVQGAFGANALCPADVADIRANGISQDTFRAELDRLLSDPVVRPSWMPWRVTTSPTGDACAESSSATPSRSAIGSRSRSTTSWRSCSHNRAGSWRT